MKPLKKILLPAMALLAISATTVVENKYVLSKNYTITILGTSNLHSWNETVETVSGTGSVTWNEDGSFNLDVIDLKMDVHSIKSDIGSIMNNNTYKALKADKNPEIVFRLTAPVQSVKAGPATATIAAKGTLTIAGVTRPVNMNVKVSIQDHTLLSFEGSQIIKMTDYGVSPPTALFGTLKTGDAITINFKTNFTVLAN